VRQLRESSTRFGLAIFKDGEAMSETDLPAMDEDEEVNENNRPVAESQQTPMPMITVPAAPITVPQRIGSSKKARTSTRLATKAGRS